jgi:hypothetical protein
MNSERPENLINKSKVDTENCSVCRDLLANLERFYSILDSARNCSISDWLTVDEIAKELKISKSIVYRLIHNGEIEAVDIVDCNSKIHQKGHYRIQRKNLETFLEHKKVRPLSDFSSPKTHIRHFLKVKNYLGL